MNLPDYIAHRTSLFYPKADEEVNRTRHEILIRGSLVYRYSKSPIQPDYSMYAEQAAAEAAWQAGLPVIRVSTNHTPTQTYQTMMHTAGRSLAEVKEERVRKVAFRELGTLLASLHRVEVAGFGLIRPNHERPGAGVAGTHARWIGYLTTRLTEHLAYLAFANLIASETAASISEVFEQFPTKDNVPFRSVLLHGDLNSSNVFVDRDGFVTAIIDWEDALGGDPLYDLAFWATFHDEKLHADLLTPYFAATERPRNFHDRFWTYYLRVAVAKLVLLHKYGHKDLTRGKARIDLALERLKTP